MNVPSLRSLPICFTTSLIAGVVAAPLCTAAPGDLDPTFGTDGVVITDVSDTNDFAQKLILLPDGKLLVAGSAHNGSDNDFALLRYDSTGKLDPAFGTGGITTAPIGSSNDSCNDAALQPDGKVVAVGSTYNGSENNFALARFTDTGTLDPSFGNGGIATATSTGTASDRCDAVAIQADGKIVVAGRVSAQDGSEGEALALLRFTPSGSPDRLFGKGGIITTTLGGTQAGALGVLIQQDGTIVVAGYVRSADASFDNFALARFTKSGAPDRTFGAAGVVVTPVNTSDADYANAIALQDNGKIVVAGQRYSNIGGTNQEFAVARYTETGELDPAFGNRGIVTTPISPGFDTAYDLAVQTDGKIVAVGLSQTGDPYEFAIVRYTRTGDLDTSFAGDGIATTAIEETAVARSVALQPDGRILVAGYSSNGTNYNVTLARYVAGLPRPDARIGKSRSVPRGDDLYNPTRDGQSIKTTLPPRGFKTIRVGIQNDSDINAAFTIKGRQGNNAFKVKYFDGTTNVTKAVVSGRFNTGPLAPGEIFPLTAKILAKTKRPGRMRTFAVSATAEDGSTRDTVRVTANTR